MNVVERAPPSSPDTQSTPGRVRALWLVGPAALYTLYLFVTGSLPHVAPPMGAQDKVVHFVAFGLLVPLCVRALRAWLAESSMPRKIWTSVGVSSALGALLEIWQSLLPFRQAELMDWVADTAGAALAGVVMMGVVWLTSRLSRTAAHEPNQRHR